MGGKAKAFFDSLPRFIWGEALGGEPGWTRYTGSSYSTAREYFA